MSGRQVRVVVVQVRGQHGIHVAGVRVHREVRAAAEHPEPSWNTGW
ncbi:MAG: hypothetical protein ABIU87_11170 [Ornithinibacter sp.]